MPVFSLTPKAAGGEGRGALSGWVRDQKAAGKRAWGLLSTVEGGRRHITRLSTGDKRLLQLNDVAPEDEERMAQRRAGPISAEDAELLSRNARDWAQRDGRLAEVVGPFVFDDAVLEWARAELSEGVAAGAECVVVDEAGPLELKRGRGLEPVLSEQVLLAGAAEGCTVVVVVRDSLLDMLRTKCPSGVLAALPGLSDA